MNKLPVRRSGKVLLVDEEQRLLLFRANEPLPDGRKREFWFPVGGGAEGGESFAECASRELFEETGLQRSPQEMGPVVAVRSGAFPLNGIDTWSDEAFFFVKVPEWMVDVSGFTELERHVVTAHRWWSMAELRSTDLLFYPPPQDLASLVTRLLASGPPPKPMELTWERPS